jgi:hypothetical protein
MHSRASLNILVVLVLVLAGAVTATGQEITGTILGNVRDFSGGAISGASIRVSHEGTGVSRTAISDSNGDYLISLLPVGVYTVRISQDGFATYEQKGIQLVVNQNARIDASLKPGSIQQVVTVEANAAQIETTGTAIGKVMDEQRVVELPLNGRNYLQLGLLQPGVAPITTNMSLSGSGAAADQGYAVNGLRTQANVFLIDGALNTDLFYTASNLKPPPDAIQEFKILTNTYSAEYWGGGSVVNLVVQSGTNAYHGSVWEFFRNDIFNTRNLFASTLPEYRQNQFGGGIGGPISIPRLYSGKNRTFFYAYYEGYRNRQGITSNASVPTTAQAAGNFNGATIIPHMPGTKTPFPNNTVPVNPISAKLLALYPQSTTGTFSASPSQADNRDGFGFRIDHHIGDHDTIWGHYLFNRQKQILPFAPFGAVVTGFPGSARATPQTVTVGETHIFSTRLLNDLHVSFNRTDFANPIFLRRDQLSTFGFTYAATAPAYQTIPFVSVTGFSSLGNPQGPGIRFTNTSEVRDSVSYVAGKHQWKFGVDVRNVRYNIIFGSSENGAFAFNGSFTGNALADFELGLPATFTQSVVGPGHLHGWTYETYAQDDWHLRPNFTLNLGVRYSAQTAISSNTQDLFAAFRVGQQSTLRPDAPANLVYQGDPNVPGGTVSGDYNNLAPRIGFAWDPTGSGKWSIRSAFGIFYEYIPGIAIYNTEFSAPPGFPSLTINAPTNYANPLTGLSNPLAPGTIHTPVTLTSLAPNLRMPYDEQWNLSIQRQLPGDVLVEVDYIGTRGVGLIRNKQVDPAVFSPGATVANTNARRVFALNFASVNQIENSASSHYHGLELSANKRFSHNLTFLGSYTWSKAIDDYSYYNLSQGTNAGNSNQPMNPNNLRLEKGLSLFDVRNRFVLSGIYQLPFGRDLTGAAGLFAKGWETNFIVTVQSGTPFTVLEPLDVSFTAVGADRPNLTCNPNSGAPHTVQQWFNTSCIQRLSQSTNAGQYGNEGRDVLIGPPLKDVDFALNKTFSIHEAMNLQLRAEFFNLFNHPHLNLPDYTAGDATFGRILNAGDGRILQFGLKFHF